MYAQDNVVRVQLSPGGSDTADGIANSTWACPAVGPGAAPYSGAACVRTPAAYVAGATLIGSSVYFKLSQARHRALSALGRRFHGDGVNGQPEIHRLMGRTWGLGGGGLG